MANKTLIICTATVVSLKTTVKKTGYEVRNVSDGRTHFMLVWKILFVSLVRGKHCVVLSLYPFYLNFLHSVNIICVFYVNYSPPQIRSTCAPN